VVGIKPSYDLVPREGVMPLAWSLDHVGPIAGNVADAAAALAVMAGGLEQPAVPSAQADGLRLVRPTNFFFEILEPSLRRVLDDALARLRSAGFAILDRPVEGVENASAIQFQTICPEATEANWQRLIESPESLGEDVRVRLEIGQFMQAKDYVRAQRLRAALAARMVAALDGADALVTPTLIVGAPLAEVAEIEVDGYPLPVHTAVTRCTAPFNLAGLPAITLPCGRDRDGLPVGLQLVGRPGGDRALVALALAAEATLVEGEGG
jgi:aspartyl-tRNA(Asn)/glutamyl-tRNA(Gln) amidotransferase subunit A